jgi:hypothetical protein
MSVHRRLLESIIATTPTATDERLLTLGQASALLNISRPELRKLVASGAIQALFRQDYLARWAAARTQDSQP